MQIVIAWAEKTKIVPAPGFVSRDANLFPATRLDWEARAAMWSRKGTDADLAKAHAFAARDGYGVYTFPATEKHPLERARVKAVEDAQRSA
jgi:hypothetical protein